MAGPAAVGKARDIDGIKVVLTQTRQTEVALENVASDNASAKRGGRIDQPVNIDTLKIFANECENRCGNRDRKRVLVNVSR